MSGTAPSSGQMSVKQQMGQVDASKALDIISRARNLDELERLRLAALHTRHASYFWNVKTDALYWSSNAAEVLGLKNVDNITTGAAFLELLPEDARNHRSDLIFDSLSTDTDGGVRFDLSYPVFSQASSSDPVSVHESGCWLPGAEGEVKEVFGLLRPQPERDLVPQAPLVDSETGLVHLEGILTALSTCLAEDPENSCGLVVTKVCNLAAICETYGAAIIPDLMRAVSARLRSVMRGVDLLGRVGRSQFAVVLRNCTTEQIQIAGDRFISAVRDSVIDTPHGPVWVELAAGGTILPLMSSNPVESFAFAEEALMAAEAGAAPAYNTFNRAGSSTEAHDKNKNFAQTIVAALNEERFKLWHQPIVDAHTGKACMFEGLLRMYGAKGEVVSAGHLVPVAEQLGFMHMIDALVCQSSLKVLESDATARISFNISSQSLADRHASSRLLEMIASSGELASRLCVEIDYSDIKSKSKNGRLFIERLKSMQCQIALNGYYTTGGDTETLEMVDFVKLDAALCNDISIRTNDQPMLEAAISYARRHNTRIVAEKIESQADADVLKSFGVDLMQGHLFGKASGEFFDSVLSPNGSTADHGDAGQKPTEALDNKAESEELARMVAIQEKFATDVKAEQKPAASASGEINLLRAALGKLDAAREAGNNAN